MRWRGIVLPAMLAVVAPFARAAAPFSKGELYRLGRESSKGGQFARAAAAFEDMIRAEPGRHTLQLAVVCERETIARLIDAGDSEEGFYFLAANVGGRECYKALWGVFASPEDARAAAARVPAELKDGKSPPVAVAVAVLLQASGLAPAAAPPLGGNLAAGPRSAPTAPGAPAAPLATAAPGPKVFTDRDLSSYRNKREDEERRYGVPKPLFDETDLRKPGSGKASPKAAAEPPRATVATSPDPASNDRAYWTGLFKSARAMVEEKRGALVEAGRAGDAARKDSARQELARAEQALADLQARAKERGANPAWTR